MLTPDQIRRRALNRYPDFLRSLCTGESLFPLTIFGAGLAKPNDFASDRAAIEVLLDQSKDRVGFGYEITWEERNFRRLGTQRIPAAVAFPSQDDYVRFIQKHPEVRQFQADYALILQKCPGLSAWAQTKPLRVVAHAGVWQGLLDVCIYLQGHPRPDCYLRELPVVVDTKFVENHKGILSELLPIASPLATGSDNSSFEVQFGFRPKQPLIRMRFLDRQMANRLGFMVDDFATPLSVFCNLPFGGNTILIVENEMTFLTLPALSETIAIFGAGDAAALLNKVPWLNSCKVFYWGDLDSHGFETLSHLRIAFPQVVSVLMDEATFKIHSQFAVSAAEKRSMEKLKLTLAEQNFHDHLVENGLLLEQERISNIYSETQLRAAIADDFIS